MENEIAKVITFYDADAECEMELVSVSHDTGLCKCVYRGAHEGIDKVTVARHRNRLRPLNDKAKDMLKVIQ